MEQRVLGKSGIKVSPIGLGCWAIGGQFYMDGKIDGYGDTDDRMSIAAIQSAMDLGINYIDTSDSYGIGHSERLVGEAIKGRRSQIVLSTKFGYIGSEGTKTLQGYNVTPDYIERACDASLRRLQTDYIDLYLLHVWEIGLSEIDSVIQTLEQLVSKGKIRTYGWSTDLTPGAKLFAEHQNCSAIQQQFNILGGNEDILKLCEDKNLASINRSPLAMGFLSGKFKRDTMLAKDDVRGAGHTWIEEIFKDGKPNSVAYDKLNAIRDILTIGGRTLVQGSLAWIWAKSGVTIPIPGFKTVEQIKENVKSIEFGPLPQAQMLEIDNILKSMN